ncbi:FAD-dependent oxidoreductase [Rhodococcus koreensis]
MVDVDIAVAGAGPVGLTAALAMARRGASVIVYERESGPGKFWRASTFHPPSLDVAADLGIIDRMLEQGLVASLYQMRDHRTGVVARFDLSAIADETAWPFRLQLEQYKYTAILTDALRELPNVQIRYGTAVVGLEQSDASARLDLNDGTSVTARWVIAADGMASTVRELAAIPFEGESYPLRRLLLSIDAPLDEMVAELDLVNYIYAPTGAGMVLRIPDLWRVMFTLSPETDDATATSRDYYGARMRELLGIDPDVVATQVYYIHQKVAATLHRQRVLVVGDAAHANSPTGGMGLNTGIHDAFDLARTLTSHGGESDTALQAWSDRRRRAVVGEVHRLSRRNTVDLGESDEVVRQRKQNEVRAIAADPQRAKEWIMESSMISNVRQNPIGVGRVAPYTGMQDAARAAELVR